jgi:hypothetical protein
LSRNIDLLFLFILTDLTKKKCANKRIASSRLCVCLPTSLTKVHDINLSLSLEYKGIDDNNRYSYHYCYVYKSCVNKWPLIMKGVFILWVLSLSEWLCKGKSTNLFMKFFFWVHFVENMSHRRKLSILG